jgi:flagellar biosynthesis protein FlhA
VLPGRWLAINPGGSRPPLEGISTMDPAYGLPALWIADETRQSARAAGYTVVDAGTVFLTHLTEVLKQNAHNLITRAETERLIAGVRERNASLVDELVPKLLSLSDIQRVLQNLVRERVPIRNMESILETLADAGSRIKDAEQLTEQVRERLAGMICQQLVEGRTELAVLTLDPGVEQSMASAVRAVDDKVSMVLDPRVGEPVLRKLAEETERMTRADLRPVLVCAPVIRRHVRRFTERLLPQLAVLSLNEVPAHLGVRSFGVVKP